jgi:hypothetical protein
MNSRFWNKVDVRDDNECWPWLDVGYRPDTGNSGVMER